MFNIQLRDVALSLLLLYVLLNAEEAYYAHPRVLRDPVFVAEPQQKHIRLI